MKLFKGNDDELKVIDAIGPIFDATSAALDDMYENAADSSAFLLMLFDNDLVPYSQRIKRESFVNFYREALDRFPYTGTFESYIFVLKAIFGDDAEILFASPSPGTLEFTVNVTGERIYDFLGYDDSGEFLISTEDNVDTLAFSSITGFESSHDVELLFSEMLPMGIIPTYAINFYDYSTFVADDSLDTLYDVVTEDGNQIVFYEIGE